MGLVSATDIDPRPCIPHANRAAYRRPSPQVKMTPGPWIDLAVGPAVRVLGTSARYRRFVHRARHCLGCPDWLVGN